MCNWDRASACRVCGTRYALAPYFTVYLPSVIILHYNHSNIDPSCIQLSYPLVPKVSYLVYHGGMSVIPRSNPKFKVTLVFSIIIFKVSIIANNDCHDPITPTIDVHESRVNLSWPLMHGPRNNNLLNTHISPKSRCFLLWDFIPRPSVWQSNGLMWSICITFYFRPTHNLSRFSLKCNVSYCVPFI